VSKELTDRQDDAFNRHF